MLKSGIIRKVAASMTHLSEKQVAEGVNYLLAYMKNALTDGKRIEIRDFGSFSLRHQPSRMAHNPKTGEKVITEDKYSVYFKPGKGLRERVNASRGVIPITDKEKGHKTKK